MSEPDQTTTCPRCSGVIPSSAPICRHCGFEVWSRNAVTGSDEQACPQCGGRVRPGMARCRECGARLHAKGDDAATGPRKPEAESDVRAVPAGDASRHDSADSSKRRASSRRQRDESDVGQPLQPSADQERHETQSDRSPHVSEPTNRADQAGPRTEFSEATTDPSHRSVVATLPEVAVDAATNRPGAETGEGDTGDADATSRPAPPSGTPDGVSPRFGRRMRVALGTLLVVGLVAAVAAGVLSQWEPRAEGFRGALESPVAPLRGLLYSPDGERLVAGSATGEVVVWNLETREARVLERVSEQPILSLALSDQGDLLAGDADRNLVRWDVGSARPERIPRFVAPVVCTAFRPARTDGFEVVLGLANGTLVFLDESGDVLDRPSGHAGYAKSVAYRPDGSLLVTGGTDGVLVWRDAETREVIEKRDAHTSEVPALAFSDDGHRLASGDWNGGLRLWNVETRESVETTQPDAVSSVGFLTDHLVTGSWDGRLRFWSLEGLEPAGRIDTGGIIHDLAVAPGGRTVATTSERTQVDLWRAPVR